MDMKFGQAVVDKKAYEADKKAEEAQKERRVKRRAEPE